MDSYLEIAYKVLKASRRPMTAKGILDAAYKAGIAPDHLFGRTQQKTLQARLSEDILHRRLNSPFFRTEPGYFFLAELIADPDIPEKYKEPFPARRRTRDLHREGALALDLSFADVRRNQPRVRWDEFLRQAEAADALHYVLPQDATNDQAPIWTFSMVRRDTQVLTYRIGRYRDDRDIFADRRTIGFPGLVSVSDRTFFSQDDYGISENALNVVLADLDLSPNAFGRGAEIDPPVAGDVLLLESQASKLIALVTMEWSCPDWFEPTTRRLSLNHPCWLDLAVRPNDLDDFEPWSIAVIEAIFETSHW